MSAQLQEEIIPATEITHNMTPIPVNGWLGFLSASAASAIGWLARHTIKRVDKLEHTSITKDEFIAFCQSREHVDAERIDTLERLENKMDRYHQDMTQRVDRILERK